MGNYRALVQRLTAAKSADRKPAAIWTKRIIDLFLPTVCAVCSKLGPIICPDCLKKFPVIEGPCCMRCGYPLEETAANCARCRTESFNLQQVQACFAFSEPIAGVVHRYKYEGLFALAHPLGTLMARLWPDWAHPVDVIVPIPLHPRRQRARGFNQAALLAQQLSSHQAVEVNEQILRRVRYTIPQIGLSPTRRKENVWQAFAAEPGSLNGMRVLLIDDVYTTGATMTSAANALLNAGAKSVSAYCLARAV
ncbi:MAG: phosphoribosyltransferase family protein [Candidatus Promineifilaceae bacterium]